MPLAERKSISLIPDLKRVLFQFFDLDKLGKSKNIFERIKSLPESTAAELLDKILIEFDNRHRDLEA
ncbi:MAG: glycosidase, partial [Candidatus Marinimicrobia bacterium]|nr:glycosidase [Candidatus Neomarinimicrobiota bacterium]